MRDGARMQDRLSEAHGKTPKLIKSEYQFLSVSLYCSTVPKRYTADVPVGTLFEPVMIGDDLQRASVRRS